MDNQGCASASQDDPEASPILLCLQTPSEQQTSRQEWAAHTRSSNSVRSSRRRSKPSATRECTDKQMCQIHDRMLLNLSSEGRSDMYNSMLKLWRYYVTFTKDRRDIFLLV